MPTVHVRIANSDGAVPFLDWVAAVNDAVDAVVQLADQTHAAWSPDPGSLVLCCEITDSAPTLRARLAEFAAGHPESAVTWAVVGDAEPIAPAAVVAEIPNAADAIKSYAELHGDGWRCKRCGSPKWVAASLTGPVGYGGRAIRQCVPCGRYSGDPVDPEHDHA